MANKIASNVFQIISLIFIILTLLPQVILNYRLKHTKNFSTMTIILVIIGAEVTFVYLIWSGELIIISIAFGIFISTGLFIGCQIKYYEEKNIKIWIKRLKFFGHYLLFLIWSITNGLALYYIFELTKSHLWIPKLIGAIVPVVIDSITFIPQIILIIQMKSAVGYSLLSIIAELIGSISGLISTCLQEDFDIVPLITFISIFISQLIMIILKLCIFPDKISSESQIDNNSNPNDVIITIDNNLQNYGLIPISHSNQTQFDDDAIQFCLPIELKTFFNDEIHGYHFASDQSDQFIAKYFINKIENDDSFYIINLSYCVKQYFKWNSYFPHIKPYYSLKINRNNKLIKLMEKLGIGFDCSSIDELKYILSICPNIDCSKRILYNNRYNSISNIKFLKEHQIQFIIIDNENELIELNKYWPNVKILIDLQAYQFVLPLLNTAKRLNLNIIGFVINVNRIKTSFPFIKQSKLSFHLKTLYIQDDFSCIDQDDKDLLDQLDMEIIGQSGKYFSGDCMNMVTSIIACRYNKENQSMENIYYINESIFGSLANILYEKKAYYIDSLEKENDEKTYKSVICGSTGHVLDCLSLTIDLPMFNIGSHILIYHVNDSYLTKFNECQPKKYFYIWKD